MQTGRNQHTATLLSGGKVLLAAGSTDTAPLKSAEVFGPTNNSFTAVGNLVTARKSHTATLLSNNQVLITGGKVPPVT
ncbi:MAG: kelch repeat-containing protein [Chthoniobacterales bacterium]